MGLGQTVLSSISNSDLVASAPATTSGQKPSKRQIFHSRYNHGTNLGSMFVLERWIAGYMFEGLGENLQSELEAVKFSFDKNGLDSTKKKWQDHWTNWLKEEDWKWLAERGVNSVRVPVGYWIVGNGKFTKDTPFEHYSNVYSKAWDLFKQLVIQKASQYNIGVLVDLHGVPGGANGENHSGTSSGKAELWGSSKNQSIALEVLEYMAKDLKPYDNVVGLELVNEAVFDSTANAQKAFYLKAIKRIRSVNSDIPIVLSDGWDLTKFCEFVNENEARLKKSSAVQPSLGVILDTHVYRCFSAEDRSKSPDDLINGIPNSCQRPDNVDLMVGEFSCVLDKQTWSKLGANVNHDDVVKRFGKTQTDHFYEKAKCGVYFWTYKFHGWRGGEWDFREMIDRGALPTYPTVLTKVNRDGNAYQQAYQQRAQAALDEHVNYWNAVDPSRDWQFWRYKEGFTTGWFDALSFDDLAHSEIGRTAAWKNSRRAEHTKQKGSSDLEWAWDHGFDKGVKLFLETRKHLG